MKLACVKSFVAIFITSAIAVGLVTVGRCAPAPAKSTPAPAKNAKPPAAKSVPKSTKIKTAASPPTIDKAVVTSKIDSASIKQQLQPIAAHAATAQLEVLGAIEKKSGEITAPTPPKNDLLQWQRERWRAAIATPPVKNSAAKSQLKSPSVGPLTVTPKPDADNATLQGLLGEDLTLAQKLLADADPQQQRRGLRVARDAAIKTAARIGDKVLVAQIFDGFIVPHLDVAYSGAGLLSRQRLLQDAASAYNAAGQREKEATVLSVLVRVAEEEKNIGRADRARLKLAAALMTLDRYEEAKTALEAVSSPDMTAGRALLPEIEKKINAGRATKAPEQNHETNPIKR